jgi:hypothetical protein
MKMSFDVKRLNAVLSNCEDAVLLTSDVEVTAGCDAEIGETAAFIQARLAQYRALSPLPPTMAMRRGSVRANIPRDAAGRRRLLGRLIASRPELPTRISMAFKSREPRDEEVAEMLNELLRNGSEDWVE